MKTYDDCQQPSSTMIRIPPSLSLSSAESIQAIQRELKPIQIEEFLEEIYLIYPIVSERKQVHSLIVYEDYMVLTWCSPKAVIEKWLCKAHHLEYNLYAHALNQLLQHPYYKMPCATSIHSLFPTESPRNIDTAVWLNPRRITQLKPTTNTFFKSILTLENGVQLHSELEIRTLKKMMMRSFKCHAIIKQEYTCCSCIKTQSSLVQSLIIPSNQLTSQFSSRLEQQVVLPPRGTFEKNYKQQLIQHKINELYS